ncbi:uncharacterized protein LOC131605663 [Vicia villosa]|uniref:uncharacterized protein LOC131605663 n=1 Tax=Vicia villosa TaxID=3911 RepID=UPI00273AE4AF|nr:uncharacterized protein LOC131605663 [Vicia villosa]
MAYNTSSDSIDEIGMVHPDNILRELIPSVDVSPNVEGVVVKAVDVGGDFNNKQEFDGRESMLTWIRRNATDLGFGAVIGRSDYGTTRRNVFVTMLCERSGKYHPSLRKFKRDDTGTRKCECPFKIRGYMVASKKWRFNVICGLHNHDMCGKLQGHPNVCQVRPEEKTCVNDMSLNLVQPKNILTTLKRKEPDNISNIRQVYNIQYCNNKAVKENRSEMQQLLKMLDDSKYVSRKVKSAVETKQVETNGGKSVKPGVIVEQIMDAWTRIVKEKFVCAWTNNVRHLGNTTTNRVESTHASLKNWLANRKGDLCRDWDTVNFKIKNQHNEIQTTFGQSITVLEHRFWDNILYCQLIGNVSRVRLNYIFHEAKRGEIVGSDSVKCGCTITRTYGLPCVCVIAKKARLGEPIRMEEVIPHWKRLSFHDDGCVEGEKSTISITSELEAIQERFSKADDNMKLHIKEKLRKIGYPETTDMKPPSQPVKTKDAPKKLKPTPNDNSTTRSPSYCEHIDKLFPDSPTPKPQKTQKSSNKGDRISKPPPTPIPLKIPIIEEMPILSKIPFIEEMKVFMHPYIV